MEYGMTHKYRIDPIFAVPHHMPHSMNSLHTHLSDCVNRPLSIINLSIYQFWQLFNLSILATFQFINFGNFSIYQFINLLILATFQFINFGNFSVPRSPQQLDLVPAPRGPPPLFEAGTKFDVLVENKSIHLPCDQQSRPGLKKGEASVRTPIYYFIYYLPIVYTDMHKLFFIILDISYFISKLCLIIEQTPPLVSLCNRTSAKVARAPSRRLARSTTTTAATRPPDGKQGDQGSVL
jgi:hypothetical protein